MGYIYWVCNIEVASIAFPLSESIKLFTLSQPPDEGAAVRPAACQFCQERDALFSQQLLSPNFGLQS